MDRETAESIYKSSYAFCYMQPIWKAYWKQAGENGPEIQLMKEPLRFSLEHGAVIFTKNTQVEQWKKAFGEEVDRNIYQWEKWKVGCKALLRAEDSPLVARALGRITETIKNEKQFRVPTLEPNVKAEILGDYERYLGRHGKALENGSALEKELRDLEVRRDRLVGESKKTLQNVKDAIHGMAKKLDETKAWILKKELAGAWVKSTPVYETTLEGEKMDFKIESVRRVIEEFRDSLGENIEKSESARSIARYASEKLSSDISEKDLEKTMTRLEWGYYRNFQAKNEMKLRVYLDRNADHIKQTFLDRGEAAGKANEVADYLKRKSSSAYARHREFVLDARSAFMDHLKRSEITCEKELIAIIEKEIPVEYRLHLKREYLKEHKMDHEVDLKKLDVEDVSYAGGKVFVNGEQYRRNVDDFHTDLAKEKIAFSEMNMSNEF